MENPNAITIDLEKVRQSDNHSITDVETIRQISLHMRSGEDLSEKINPNFIFAGLYPEIMQSFKILPERFGKAPEKIEINKVNKGYL